MAAPKGSPGPVLVARFSPTARKLFPAARTRSADGLAVGIRMRENAAVKERAAILAREAGEVGVGAEGGTHVLAAHGIDLVAPHAVP